MIFNCVYTIGNIIFFVFHILLNLSLLRHALNAFSLPVPEDLVSFLRSKFVHSILLVSVSFLLL